MVAEKGLWHVILSLMLPSRALNLVLDILVSEWCTALRCVIFAACLDQILTSNLYPICMGPMDRVMVCMHSKVALFQKLNWYTTYQSQYDFRTIPEMIVSTFSDTL